MKRRVRAASIFVLALALSSAAAAEEQAESVPARSFTALQPLLTPGERLIVRSQITLLDEAAIALKDHSIGFTLARDFDPRELGLHALKRVAQQDYQRAVVSPPER